MSQVNSFSCRVKKVNHDNAERRLSEIVQTKHRVWLVLGLFWLLGGCAGQKDIVDQLIRKHDFDRQLFTTERYSHWIIASRSAGASNAILHIYIEGDGIPWLRDDLIAADPTPHNPLALKLMAQDHTPSVYLGRPCYFGLATSQHCSPAIWTNDRYSEQVVASMQAALGKFLLLHPYKHLIFIGYSGGGVLAMLLAPRFPDTEKVITIASNLDTRAWTEFHHYSSLIGSLNPATQPPLPASIKQIHFSGKRDTNVPTALIHYVSSLQPNSTVRIRERFDHVCCWEKEWTNILKDF